MATGSSLTQNYSRSQSRKIITPFRKLVRVTNGAEYVGDNIEKLFDEARQNMQRQHKTWEKYYDRKRREVNIKVNDLVLKKGKRITVNIDQIRVYHPRHSDTNSFDSTNETLYEGKGCSNGSSRSNPGKSRRSRKPSGDKSKSCKSNKATAGLEDLRFKRKNERRRFSPPNEESRRGARVQSGRARENRTTGSKEHSATERRPVRSRKTKTVKPCLYYLRSRFKEPE
ncbi:uncharacterized protein TNCV_1450851 [Trichonephila clavipes]|nr:uncharacterized protein TNCV_1450851 [Trichonephila clavipes]